MLISDCMFYGTSRVLTSVVTHHPDLDFVAICRGYADGWHVDKIHVLGDSLVPHAQMVAEQVTTQWVMEAHRSTVATDVRQEDIVQPTKAARTGSWSWPVIVYLGQPRRVLSLRRLLDRVL